VLQGACKDNLDNEDSSRLPSRVPLEDGVADSRIINEVVDGNVCGGLRLPAFAPREGVGRWVFREVRGDPEEFSWAFAWISDWLIYRFDEFGHLGSDAGVLRAWDGDLVRVG
jgi:hypothetical protein